MSPTIHPELLTASQSREFSDKGFLVLSGFYHIERDIRPIQEGIHRIIGEVLKRHGVVDITRASGLEDFDDGYAALISLDRRWGGEVYDAIKQIPAFLRLVSDPRNEQLFRELRSGCIPGVAAGGYGIRIDNPNEERFRAPWHQEYPAQLRSLDGVVFWTPLVPISPELGPVVICPGSHSGGPIQVYTRDREHPEKDGAYALRLKDESEVLSKYSQIRPLLTPGDLLMLDFLTLHASGQNVGSRSRWTIQFRYFNFGDATGRSHGWQGSYAAGVDFRTIHPELCAD